MISIYCQVRILRLWYSDAYTYTYLILHEYGIRGEGVLQHARIDIVDWYHMEVLYTVLCH